MKRLLLIPLLLIPLSAGAVVYPEATSTPKNAYVLQPRVTALKPQSADFIAAGGVVMVPAPVVGDVLAAGGTVSVTGGAGGDIRVAGGKVTVNGDVGGDLAAAGGTLNIKSRATNIYAAGGSVTVEGGSTGDVTIYGANVFLSGDYEGNVSIVASNRLTLGQGTHIRGTLRYSAPEELVVPAAVVIDGGARYTGAYAYVPTNEQAHQYALIGMILFFAVRVLAGSIVAGLIAGLFNAFSERISSMVLTRRVSFGVKLLALGLAVAVLTPLIALFLLVSFVGAELAILLIVLYALLTIVSYAFSGIVAGALLRRTLLYKINGERDLTWQDAVLGTVLVHAIGLVPVFGTFAVLALTLVCAGAIVRHLYQSAFSTHS